MSLGGGTLPDSGGDRPHVAVTIDYQTLRDQITAVIPPTLGSGVEGRCEITPQTARRIACDAKILPAVLGGDSQLLDLGRDTRTWTIAQRRAAAIRDKGCVFPTCGASLAQCELHHLSFWANGGHTDIDNSAHLCHFHHWMVHHTAWTITRNKVTKQIHVQRS